MAAFRFSLEPLLKLRRLEEDRAKAAFLRALAGFRGKEAEIAALTAKREEAKERCRQSQPGRIDIEEVLRARRFINVLFQRISEKRVELNALRPALEEARSAHRRAGPRRRARGRVRGRRGGGGPRGGGGGGGGAPGGGRPPPPPPPPRAGGGGAAP